MKITPELFRNLLEHFSPARHYFIAYSGGIDSRVLLDLCAELASADYPGRFKAVHIHHGLLPEADAWAANCEEVCRRLGIPFRSIRVNAAPRAGESPEEAARNARYRALREVVEEGDALLTAQHRDDQAETVLLQLFRGAGLAGLSGMPEEALFGRGRLLRPLLRLSRRELEQYALERGLSWVEDPSNRDLAYERNFLRHRVFPLLRERWPGLDKTLERCAVHCAEARVLIDGMARDLCRSIRHPERDTLLIDKLADFAEKEQRVALRAWIRSRGMRAPPTAIINRVLCEVLAARPDSAPRVRWGGNEIRRFRGELYLLPILPDMDPDFSCRWSGEAPLRLPSGCGVLEARPVAGQGLSASHWRRGPVTVRFRRGGERCRIPGRGGRHALKNIFQERGVPPWVRERIPLVYIGDELAAVGDLFICAPFQGEGAGSDAGLVWYGHDAFWKIHDGKPGDD